MSEAKRAYIYRVILALLVVAAVIGRITGQVIDQELLSSISEAAGVILGIGGVGLAVKNTSTKG